MLGGWGQGGRACEGQGWDDQDASVESIESGKRVRAGFAGTWEGKYQSSGRDVRVGATGCTGSEVEVGYWMMP